MMFAPVALRHQVGNVLHDGVALQPFGAAFAAEAAVLDAAERCLGARGHEVVDRQVADLDALGHPLGLARRVGEGIAGQAVGTELAFSIASSRLRTRLSRASGPNGSSRIARASSGTSASTVNG